MDKLSNPKRRKIFQQFLYAKSLKFNEIEKATGIRSNELAYFIQKLVDDSILLKEGDVYRLTETAEKYIPFFVQSEAETSPLPVVLVACVKQGKVLLWKRNKFFGVGLAVIGLMTAVLLHFFFYTTNEIYQPFHLLKRAEVNLQIPLIVIGGIVSAIGAFFVLIKVRSSFTSWLFWFAFSLTIPLIFISFGEFDDQVKYNLEYRESKALSPKAIMNRNYLIMDR